MLKQLNRSVGACIAAIVATLSMSNATVAQTAAPATRPTLYLVGDSTVRVGTPAQMGWGDPLIAMFDPEAIRVVNKAIGGRSSRSFIQEGRWDEVIAMLTPGDYVIVQMGHNDGGPLAGDNRERGSLRGIGEETEEVTLTLGDNAGKRMTVHTYGWYLRKYVADARAKGATPILCSPIPRCPRPGEPVAVPAEPTSYPLWARQVAEAERVPFLDLHRSIWQRWVELKLTPEQIKQGQFTPGADFTHTSAAGAAFNASVVADVIRAAELPLARALRG